MKTKLLTRALLSAAVLLSVAAPGVQAPATGDRVGVRLLRHRVYPA